MRRPPLLAGMALAIVLVTALAFWDEERESAAALADFAAEQATLAEALGAGLAGAGGAAPERLLAGAATIERPGALRCFVARPGAEALVGTDGAAVREPTLLAAIAAGAATAELTRPAAAALGLPARMALAGLHRVDGPGGPVTFVVVATAQVERDRERRARWRLVLGVGVASGLVLVFGGLALKRQRERLELAHALDLAALRTERDERLVRADKLATMGALATGIAHEVATPLGVILGRAEQLLPKQTDERARRAVEAIAAETERIHAVIRGFLALARGKAPPLERHAPGELARAAVGLVEHRFENAGVALRVAVAPGLPEVLCEPRLFEQVLVNLLLNACDACAAVQAGEPRGEVLLAVEPGAERVAFVVTDDGVGISSAAATRVTEPFFTTKAEGAGTGLGLAIASELVKHHMGTLSLRPRAEGRGTRAAVEIPPAT